MRKYGTEGKKRFTIKYHDGTIFQTGTCDPKQDERFDIIRTASPIQNNEGSFQYDIQYWLVQYQKDDYDYSQPPKERTLLPDGTLVANGYYDHEWDEFVTPEQWVNEE